jgi:hypothetical protein
MLRRIIRARSRERLHFDPMPTIAGRCHCGNVELELTTEHELASLPLRACDCGFCRRHGARTTTDPRGSVRIVAHEPAALVRYRFGLATADMLVCGRCGVYVAGVLEADGRAWATVNANTFVPPLAGVATAVSYGSEDADARIARRRASWTPCTLVLG